MILRTDRSGSNLRPCRSVASMASLLVVALCAACPEPATENTGDVGVRLLVAPIENRGQDEGAAYVGDAFAGSLAASLALLDEVRIVDGSGAASGVAATHRLTGTLQRDNDSALVQLQLHDEASGALIWDVQERGDDLSTLARRLAGRTIEPLGLHSPHHYEFIADVTGGPQMAASPLAAEAFEANRRGDLTELAELSSSLAERFSADPDAHALNAWALIQAWDVNPSSETLTRLKERLAELSRVDSASPYDELVRAYIYRTSGEPVPALALYSTVLARTDLSNTLRAWGLRQRSLTHLQVGSAEAARSDAEQAVALDPLRAHSLIALSKSLESLGEIEGAIEASVKAVALAPSRWRLHQRLGLVYARAGRYDEAVPAIERACELGKSQEACANLAVTLQRAGLEAEARRVAEQAGALAGTPWGMYNLACYRAIAGEPDRAIGALRRSVDLGFTDTLLNTDPDLDPLRETDGFAAIVSEVEERLQARRELSGSMFPWQA